MLHLHIATGSYKEARLFAFGFRVCAGSSYSAGLALGWMDIVRWKSNGILFQPNSPPKNISTLFCGEC